jgi:hypothetical protein
MNNSNDTIGNQTTDILVSIAVPQAAVSPRAPVYQIFKTIFLSPSGHSVTVKKQLFRGINSVCCWNNRNPITTVLW